MFVPFVLIGIIGIGGILALAFSGKAGASAITTPDEPDNTLISEEDIGRIVSDFIDWELIQWFGPDEFPARELENTDPRLFVAIDKVRSILGSAMVPLPDRGALARAGKHSKGSQHWIGDDFDTPVRKSTAIDIMVPTGMLREAYKAAKQVPEIGGIGLYPEARPRGYIHLDIRKYRGQPRQWMALRKKVPDAKGIWDYPAIDFSVIERIELERA